MSRPITDLLPDLRINAPGVPEFLGTYMLSGALQEFLDRSEAWREWGSAFDFADATDGLQSWQNHIGVATQRWVRIKRVDKLQIVETGKDIPFRTANQLSCYDPMWRTRESSCPEFYTTEGELAASGSNVSGFQIRLYPQPAVGADHTILPRFVLTVAQVAGMDLDDNDDEVITIPDRIFYAFKNAIVGGALARLFLMIGKDWSNPRLATLYATAFENSVTDAKSRAERDFGHAPLTMSYGGI